MTKKTLCPTRWISRALALTLVLSLSASTALARDIDPDQQMQFEIRALTYERLARNHSKDERLVNAFEHLKKWAPDLLVQPALTRLCRYALLTKATRPPEVTPRKVLAARKKLKKLGLKHLLDDGELRKAFLIFFVKGKMEEQLAAQREQAKQYFHAHLKPRRESRDCLAVLLILSEALSAAATSGREVPSQGGAGKVVDRLVRAGHLESSVAICPHTGEALRARTESGKTVIDCPIHSSDESLARTGRSPLTMEEEKRWHQENAYVFATSLWRQKMTRGLCWENARRLTRAMVRYRRDEGSYPDGPRLKQAEQLIAAGYLPRTRAPLCPMDGRLLGMALESRDDPSLRVGCPNHGWLPPEKP